MVSPETMADPSFILDDLNPPQREAVTHIEGPLLVLAGAGSGKTRVITRRMAWLIAQGCPPDHLLAITFTNKAAGEMRTRTEALTGHPPRWIATFHSFASRILRRHASRLEPYDTSFTICDADDSKALIKSVLHDLGVDGQVWTPRHALSEISRIKTTEGGDVESLGGAFHSGRVLREIYLEHTKRMREQNLVDFDDLLLLFARLLREHPDVLGSLQEQFEFVLVDEYQDTNAIQYEICRAITARRPNLCITGDPDQSIYKWRGADIGNILAFEEDYPSATVIRLEQNYRSTANILRVANALIAHNTERKEKSLWTEDADGDPVRVHCFDDERKESGFVARLIGDEIARGTPPGDIAVFYRINSLSRTIEQDLIFRNIPYTVVGGLEFFLRKEVKDILAYLRALANPRDSVSLARILNTPARGIGATTLAKLEKLATDHQCGLLEVVLDSSLRDGIAARQSAAIDGFALIYRSLEELAGGPVEHVVRATIDESGYRKSLEDQRDAEADERLANLGELIGAAVEFDRSHPGEGLRGFLELTSLLGDVDRWERRDDRVSLMTIHGAKGLEFPVVIVVGVEEGILPLVRASEEPDYEEERRLLYVAVTRARQRLWLTHASSRMRFGRPDRSAPSQFLRELTAGGESAAEEFEALKMDLGTERTLLERARRDEILDGWDDASGGAWPETRGRGGKRQQEPAEAAPWDDDPIAAEFAANEAATPDDGDLGFEPDEDPYPDGARVLHPVYGEGEVIRTTGFGRMRRVTVRFEVVGDKQFVLAHAQLERVR